MKKFLKIAAPFLLILAAIGSLFVHVESTLDFADVAGHWAAPQIEKWSTRGVMNGSEGYFRPDDGLSLAELSAVFTRVLPLGEAAENTFDDLPDDAWFTEPVLRCVGEGIIDAEGKTALEPGRALTRGEAFVMLARALDIEPEQGEKLLRKCNDARLVEPELRPYFEALLARGLVSGENPVFLCADEPMSRADAVDMLERMERGGFIRW